MLLNTFSTHNTVLSTSYGSRNITPPAAGRRLGQHRPGQQQDASSSSDPDQVVAPIALPIDPLDLSTPRLRHYDTAATAAGSQYAGLPAYVDPQQLSSTTGSRGTQSSSSKGGRAGKPTSTRHDGRRGSLVKIRVPDRRYRLRQSFDKPRPLHVRPGDPQFEARLDSEINSVDGPKQLNKLIQSYCPHFNPSQAASAIALLAGFTTSKDLSPEELGAAYRGPAAKVARQFEGKLQGATLKDCARVVYGLARLQVHMPQLLSSVEAATAGQLRSATPQALAGLAVGLAHWGHRPSEGWVRELCLEAFVAMDGFAAQDLSNLLFSLAVWRTSVSQPFLQRSLAAFRGHWGAAGTTPAALVRFMYALTQLPACQQLPPKLLEVQPQGAPVYLHHEQYRQQRELQSLSGVMGINLMGGAAAGTTPPDPQAGAASAAVAAVEEGAHDPMHQQQQQPQQQWRRGREGTAGSGTAVATYRLPSFNWLVAFLAECRRLIDRFKPAELSTLLWSCAALNHTPDLIFMEAWFRASAVRLAAFTPATLAAAVQALGMLQPGREVPGALPGRWVTAVLDHSRGVMRQQVMAAAAAAAADVEGRQGASEQQVQAQQQRQGAGFSVSDLSKLLWGLAELRVWPGKPWLQDWLAASGPHLQSATPSDLADMTWALARLRFSPPEPWMTHLSTAITTQLQGFSPQGLATVIWGYTRLGLRPDRLWLLRFRAVAAGQEEDGAGAGSSGRAGGQQLAQFVAAFLAQQNRQRFSEGRPGVVGGRSSSSSSLDSRKPGAGRGRGVGRPQQQQQQWSPRV